MTYKELKKRILAEKNNHENKEFGLTPYIAYCGEGLEHLDSNFIEDNELATITDDQLIRAENDGLLIKDWDTLEVVM